MTMRAQMAKCVLRRQPALAAPMSLPSTMTMMTLSRCGVLLVPLKYRGS